MPIRYESAAEMLRAKFKVVEGALLESMSMPRVDPATAKWMNRIFASSTQAYREVLLGCILARIEDETLNIRKAYVNLGEGAYNGRTLDERVVNPFLHEARIPSSKGPFLAVFRRSVPFQPSTRLGTKDKEGFDAFLNLVELVQASHRDETEMLLAILLHHFAALREQATVSILKLNRASLPQYDRIVDALLQLPSGGRIPVLLILAVLEGIKQHFGLDWDIRSQGINEADAASGAGADISVFSRGKIVFSAEVTERQVEKARVVSTFQTKIAPAALEDYLFLVNEPSTTDDARAQANQYFAQGSEVNFVDIRGWIHMSLVTVGKRGRDGFNVKLAELLGRDDNPKSIKVGWNEIVAKVTSI